MAPCSSCNRSKNKSGSSDAAQEVSIKDMYRSGEFSLATYIGYGTSTRPIISPNKILKAYNKRMYAIGKPGDILLIHNEDIRLSPETFELVEDETIINDWLIRNNLHDINSPGPDVEEEPEPNVVPVETVQPEIDDIVDVEDKDVIDYQTFGIIIDEALPLSEYAKKLDIHHLKLLNLANDESTPYKILKGEDDKTYIYDL